MAEKKKGPQRSGTKSPAEASADTLRRQGRGEIRSDVQGSYTGTPEDGGVPVQDADDLLYTSAGGSAASSGACVLPARTKGAIMKEKGGIRYVSGKRQGGHLQL